MIAIPDIHGRYDRLQAILKLLKEAGKADPKNMIFLGDYVDRGPESAQVVSTLREFQRQGAIVLKGNHEGLMCDAVLKGHFEATSLWEMNGGGETRRSYHATYQDPSAALRYDAKWLQDLPLYHENETEFFSHAPLPPLLEKSSQFPDWRLALLNEQIMTWSYFQPENAAFKVPGKDAYCGHVHALRANIWLPRFYERYAYLDAGCGCLPDAKLVAFDTEEKRLYVDDLEKQYGTFE